MGGPRGPLPKSADERRRRNKPTIPTTKLPARGRPGRPPNPPIWVELGAAGTAWWKWAWRTPQAVAWSIGDHPALARRASLEDDLANIREGPELNVAELLEADPDERSKLLEFVIRTLHALAANKLAIAREARELDDRFGLTPKALAALRWTIVDDEEPAPAGPTPEGNVRRLKAVDARAVAGG